MTSEAVRAPAAALAKSAVGFLGDLALVFSMLVVALLSGSLILWGETLRSAMAAAKAFWASLVAKKTADGSLPHYEFGLGKLEQAGNLALALVMVAAGLFLAGEAFGRLVAGEGAVSQFNFALASVALAASTLACGFSVMRCWTAWRRDPLPSRRASLAETALRLASHLVLQAALTLAALSRDPVIAHWADTFGGGLVALLMLAAGAALMWDAVMDLIDHPLPRESEEAITQVLLQQGVAPEEIRDLRSRRAGRDLFLEVTLDPAKRQSLAIFGQRLADLKRALEARFEGLDLTIRLERGERPS